MTEPDDTTEPDDELERELDEIEALFVQSAKAMTGEDSTLTLHGVALSTLFFADRPRREVGHMDTRRFVELWDQGENSFADDPPNAVASFLVPDGEPPRDVVVVLHEPRLKGDALVYTVEVLDGVLLVEITPGSLFIDVFGRPLTPVSVAGIHRRARRRVRR